MINMTKNEFVRRLSEYCEFDNENFTLETRFKSIKGYDSLALMYIIAFVDENFKMKLNATQLQGLSDFNSLISLIGKEKFEND
jgi:acyl carrier protein